MKLITRAEAETAGLNRFFTGRPCKRAHITDRRVSDGMCMECLRMKSRANGVRFADYFANYRGIQEAATLTK